MNIVILEGNLTRDPELRTAGDSQVCDFGIATNRPIKRKDGSKDQETVFVDCEVWAGAAEVLAKYAKKGTAILIQGSLKLDTWEVDGQKRSKLRVRVNDFKFLGGGRSNSASSDSDEASDEAGESASAENSGAEAGTKIPF